MLFEQRLGQANVTSLLECVSRFAIILKNPYKRTKLIWVNITKTIKDRSISPQIDHVRAQYSARQPAPSASRDRDTHGSAIPLLLGKIERLRTATLAQDVGFLPSATSDQ